MLTISAGDYWRCEVPQDEWPEDSQARASILRDFEGEWKDRRQEIVFIGQQMKSGGGEARIRQAMDYCLLTDQEMSQWEKAMRLRGGEERIQARLDELFEDGFEDWPDMSHEGHDHAH